MGVDGYKLAIQKGTDHLNQFGTEVVLFKAFDSEEHPDEISR